MFFISDGLCVCWVYYPHNLEPKTSAVDRSINLSSTFCRISRGSNSFLLSWCMPLMQQGYTWSLAICLNCCCLFLLILLAFSNLDCGSSIWLYSNYSRLWMISWTASLICSPLILLPFDRVSTGGAVFICYFALDLPDMLSSIAPMWFLAKLEMPISFRYSWCLSISYTRLGDSIT